MRSGTRINRVTVVAAACTLLVASCDAANEIERSLEESSEASTVTLAPLRDTIDPEALDAQSDPLTESALDAVEEVAGTWIANRVIDGATVELVNGDARLTVRLIGVDPPTGAECLAQLASDSIQFMVGGQRALRVVGNSEVASTGSNPAYVETIGGVDIGAELIRLGLAVATTENNVRLVTYRELQSEAVEAEAGIWDPEICDGVNDSST